MGQTYVSYFTERLEVCDVIQSSFGLLGFGYLFYQAGKQPQDKFLYFMAAEKHWKLHIKNISGYRLKKESNNKTSCNFEEMQVESYAVT